MAKKKEYPLAPVYGLLEPGPVVLLLPHPMNGLCKAGRRRAERLAGQA
jgi:hypothetical protein